MVLRKDDPSLVRAKSKATEKGDTRALRKLETVTVEATPTEKSVIKRGKITRAADQPTKQPVDTSQFGPRKSLLPESTPFKQTFAETVELTAARKIDIISSIAPVGAVGGGTALRLAESLLTKGLAKLGIKFGTRGLAKGFGLKAAKQTTLTGAKATPIPGTNFIVNTKTAKLTRNILLAAGFGTVATIIIAKGADSLAHAKFQLSEAMQAIGMGRWQAAENGITEFTAEFDALEQEILNPVGWANIVDDIPILANQRAARLIIEGAATTADVFRKIEEDTQNKIAAGQTDQDDWKQRDIEQKEQEEGLILFYNEQRKLQVQWEQDARNTQRQEDARFWAAERAKQREKEAEDRKAIADFWELYRKKIQEINEANRPSNLNFGLI